MTVDITLRQVKGAPLTFNEVDDNFSNLKAAADSASSDLSVIESDVAGIDARLTTAEGEIDTIQSNATTLTGRVNAIEADYTTESQSESIADNAVAAHVALADPHTQYLTGAESVNYAATKSAGDTLAASLADGATVIVEADESATPVGVKVRYTVASGALTGAVIENAAKVRFTPAGVGAVARTAQDKMRDVVSVKDFGAVGDGVTDDTAAIQAAINYASDNSGSVYIPFGVYRVGDLMCDRLGGVSLIGQRQAHESNATGGSILLYTGTGTCLTFARAAGAFQYFVFVKDITIRFLQNADGGLSFKNIQETVLDNVGVWADVHTVQRAFTLDGAGIFHMDKCVSSRCLTAVKTLFDVPPNPQGSGNVTIKRCNFFFCTTTVDLGYIVGGIDISSNFFEGFQTGVLLDNSSPQVQVYGAVIQKNIFLQSTNGLTQTRALLIRSSNNANPIRAQVNFDNNFCYMNSTGATAPSYAVEVSAGSNASVVIGRLKLSKNFIHGATVSGSVTDTQKITLVDEDNDCRNDLDGVPIPGSSGLGARLSGVFTLAGSTGQASAPNNTSENVVASFTIPGYQLGKNGSLNLITDWSVTNNGNTKIIRVRLGGPSGTIYMQHNATGVALVSMRTRIANRNAFNSQIGASDGNTNVGVSESYLNASSIDTADDVLVVITVEKGLAGDIVNLEQFIANISPR